jgi:hypothetical protein
VARISATARERRGRLYGSRSEYNAGLVATFRLYELGFRASVHF